MQRLMLIIPLVLFMMDSLGAGVRDEIKRLIRESGAEVGVAFETLDGKLQFFYQEDLSFHAASTMKVPVMIELFRQAEEKRLNLEDLLPVVNAFHSIVDGSTYHLEVGDDSDVEIYSALGESRTLLELCEAMITISSNLAANLLIERLGAERIQATVDRLGGQGMLVLRGVEDDKAYQQGLSNTTTARGFFQLLKRLARGEAVSPEADHHMVEILEKQHFNEGIPSGLPAGIAVAHKTGQITRIHHDGGIVFSQRPFVVVVLVRGIEEETASARLIAAITRALYRWAEGWDG